MIRKAVSAVVRFLLNHVVLKLVAGPVRRNLTRFEAATHNPRAIQEALLADILRHQADTGFGRDNRFASMRTVADYRRVLPVRGYEAIEPYIERVRKGDTKALLNEHRIHMFALTSGTTATRKYIPVTDRYLEDYKRSWNIWGLKIFLDHPHLKLRPIVQMAGDDDEIRTEAGIPCGAVTGLTAKMQKSIVRLFYCIPAALARVHDAQAKYYAALRLSMPRDVSMLVAANPSTMLNLARSGDMHKERLIRDIRDGTLSGFDYPREFMEAARRRLRKDPVAAKRLEEIATRTGTLYPKDYWTNGFLLGNWTGGSVGAYLRHYPRYFGENIVRDVGLIASEGRMTIPFTDHSPAGVLDVTTHYFEFIPEAEGDSPQPTVLGAHELLEGGRYFILLTTAYGLYRYHIHDLVRCTGFHNGTPLIEFLSKGANFSNLTGEKISEYQITQSVASVLRDIDATLGTYSVAPVWPDNDSVTPWYGLFVEPGDESVAEQLAPRLDAKLRAMNIEYDAKRESQRLGSLRVHPVVAGFWMRWDAERLRRNGGTLEQYKHPCLIADLEFARKVPGR
ncbi:MAG: auxin-responsive protein [Planctomycetia bacterium]|nr:auxin-responsive protein [Planctomycetia bacterium]